jgi:hypothetical protein
MGKTESFSKSQLSRAYQRLRPMLEAEIALAATEHGLGESELRRC